MIIAGGALTLAGCGASGGPVRPASTSSAPIASARATACRARQDRPQPGWQGPNALTGVQFVSPTHGWVVGLRQILATSDGGRHWAVQDSGSLGLMSVDFVDGEHGWAAGVRTLLRTSDGGRRWTALAEPCPAIRQVTFVSQSVGFAVAGGTALFGETYPAVPLHGGVLLGTTDGGRRWTRLAAPAGAQSVCFDTASNGWLGAGGALYLTTDGGRSWQPTSVRVRPPSPGFPGFLLVRCAGRDAAWAMAVGPGAAMNQQPHIGYHAGPGGTRPVFAEQYFPHPGVRIAVNSPGSYPGAVSAISPAVAAFVDYCPACGYGTVPWALASGAGRELGHPGTVAGLTSPADASFVSPQAGWVVGTLTRYPRHGKPVSYPRIVSTADGGRTWQVDYPGAP